MIWKAIMEKLEKLYEGKAKQLYATDDPEVLWVEYKNSATAGDGEKKEDFAGKGRLNNLITTLIFDLLKKRGIDSHLVARVGETSQLVKKVTMFPLEIVLRNTAAGHFCSRLGVEVYAGCSSVVHISKELFHWGDTYTINILNSEDEIPALMLVIAIDAANCTQGK